MAGRVYVAGSANIDLVAAVRRLPGPGETVLASALQSLPGGKGANQAIAASKAGSPVTFFGCVGGDSFGDEIVGALNAAAVDTTFLDRSATPTGTALIAVDENGQNQITIFPGANSRLMFCEGFDSATQGDVLICQNECPLDVVFQYFTAAKDRQVATILNAAPVVDLPGGLLDHVDILIVNESEGSQYCSKLPASADPNGDVKILARHLRVRRDQIIIVTLGEKGVVALVEDRFVSLPGHKVRAVDTTGAGDCFCGFLASALATGKPLEHSLAFANAAAAIAVQRQGASIAMPSREEVEAFLQVA